MLGLEVLTALHSDMAQRAVVPATHKPNMTWRHLAAVRLGREERMARPEGDTILVPYFFTSVTSEAIYVRRPPIPCEASC